MSGHGPHEAKHALLMYSADGQLRNGTTTHRDVPGARRLAQQILVLQPTIAYIELYECSPSGQLASGTLERVDWDQEWSAAR
ncbi:hypothetical protein [Dictyobacter aurantiacus]|uniref:Uncharacterized protein n=1 Tax=Dictyobacter aurantiacus TaxID=1936993 RepID=A0A401ZFW1_9CHLR|nr:hypothetical protein [Dictyobacter aurantiacus]GCE05757.1 hypothetical protein KDAU_30860 [Dictyobacter aurantiacus]